jgi:hypothetical protein
MQYIYHMMPENMQGTVLYPLNVLKSVHPDLYTTYIEQYNDHPSRQTLPSRVIPKLNCLWNDVVQCSPIHPHHLYRALIERNLQVKPDKKFFQIPVNILPDVLMAVYSSAIDRRPNEAITEDEVSMFNRRLYRELDAFQNGLSSGMTFLQDRAKWERSLLEFRTLWFTA